MTKANETNKIARDRLLLAVSNECGVKTATVGQVLSGLARLVWASAREGKVIEIPGLGKFSTSHRKDVLTNCVRTGKNGKTNNDPDSAQKIFNPANDYLHFTPNRIEKRRMYLETFVLPTPEHVRECNAVLSREMFETIRIRFGEDVAMKYKYSSDQLVECDDGSHFISSGNKDRDSYKRRFMHF